MISESYPKVLQTIIILSSGYPYSYPQADDKFLQSFAALIHTINRHYYYYYYQKNK